MHTAVFRKELEQAVLSRYCIHVVLEGFLDFSKLLVEDVDFLVDLGGASANHLCDDIAVHCGIMGVNNSGVADAFGAYSYPFGIGVDGFEEVVNIHTFEGTCGFSDLYVSAGWRT